MGEEERQEENQQSNSQIELTETSESTNQQGHEWPLKIKFDVPPYRTYHFHKQFRTGPNPNNFLKGVKWSPDGSCFLASSEDNTLRLFSLPDNGSSDHVTACSSASEEDSYKAELVVSEGESVYDFCWHPYMSASDPVTCVFATTTRDHPIHLWDAISGLLHCTYRAYDAVDELTAAFSVSFNPAGTKVFAGYNKYVRVFDVHRPGRDFAQYSTLQGNKEGQTGIISAIAFCPAHTGMLATGSYSQTTAIYREDNMELLYVLHGQEGGVTQVQFSKDGNYLYTGARKDPYIMCWDIRKAVEVVYKLYRSSEDTNQRIAFDIESSGRHLGSGGQDGLVHIYDLQTGQWVSGFQVAAGAPLSFRGVTIPMANPSKKLVPRVIFDLDGTLLNTDGVIREVLKGFLGKYGKQWDGREAQRIIGKTRLEAAAAIVEEYGLPCGKDEFLAEIHPILSAQFCNIKPRPGANRLLKHLSGHGVPMALASNSPRGNIESKISYHQGWKDYFSVIVGGDEVTAGKPNPAIFLEAAKRLNTEPSSCLVIEDSMPGVTAGKDAGIEVIAVPSDPKQAHLYTPEAEVINSLLDLQPEKWGLPSFQDRVEGTLPIEPWYIGGPVIKGFGRGSKVHGIRTANLSTEGHSSLLSEHPSGVYFGWAGLSTRGVYKMVMSIGWNPYFNNAEKTIEPRLLHEFNEDFYGEELHLVIVGYIRPEVKVNFPTLESLIVKIQEDRKIAETALDLPLYSKHKDDPYLKSC